MIEAFLITVKDFVSQKVIPWVKDHDENTYPETLVEEMKKLGLFGMNIPEQFGGLELSLTEICTLISCISEGSTPLVSIFGSHMKVCSFIHDFGTDEQKERLLPDLASGKIIAAFAYTEAVGKSPQHLETTVTKKEQGFTLSGAKSYVTNALHADLFAVVARFEKEKDVYTPAITLIDRNASGFSVGQDLQRMGLKLISVCTTSFIDCPINITKDVLGYPITDASVIMESTKISELLQYASRAIGLGKFIIKETKIYIEAKKSGDTLLVNIPLVIERITEMEQLQASSEKLIQTVLDQNVSKSDAFLNACVTKVRTTEAVVRIALLGLKLHGGTGYMEHSTAGQNVRDALGLTIIGTPTDILISKIYEMNPAIGKELIHNF